MVVKTARQMKPEGLKFYEDFSQRLLQRSKELIPELIRKGKQGKKAFLVMDRIVEYKKPLILSTIQFYYRNYNTMV